MLTAAEQPSGMHRHEGIIEVLSLMETSSGKHSVRVQWIGQYLPLLTLDDISDDEWEVFQKATRSNSKKILIASPVAIKNLRNFHNVYMENLA